MSMSSAKDAPAPPSSVGTPALNTPRPLRAAKFSATNESEASYSAARAASDGPSSRTTSTQWHGGCGAVPVGGRTAVAGLDMTEPPGSRAVPPPCREHDRRRGRPRQGQKKYLTRVGCPCIVQSDAWLRPILPGRQGERGRRRALDAARPPRA